MTALRTLKFAAILTTACTLTLPATANSWLIWEGQPEDAPRAIYSTNVETSDVILTCNAEGKLAAIISAEPGDLTNSLAKNSPYARSEEAALKVGEKDAVETVFRYRPAAKTLETRSHSIAAKLFNSAVTGDKIELSLETLDSIETSLPAPDATMKAFARTCQAARSKANNE